MKLIIAIIAIFYCNVLIAQQVVDTTVEEEIILINPETLPEFPGGRKALYEYLEKENRWVQKHTTISGIVYVRFMVSKDGTLTEIEVVKGLENICNDCNEEAIRLVRNMPKWRPGLMYDIPVDNKMILPVKFGHPKKSAIKK